MKYLIQILTVLLPVAGWVLSSIFQHQITIYHVDVVITYSEIVLFIFLIFLNSFVYVMLLWHEIRHRRVCHTLAQFVSIFGVIIFSSYTWLTYQWMCTAQATGTMPVVLDTLYGFINMLLGVYSVIVCQFITVSLFGKSVIPFWCVNPKKPIGSYLVNMGVDREIIEEAYRLQQDDTKK